MPIWHHDLDKKKITGGRRKAYRKKRRHESGGFATETRFDTSSRVTKKVHSSILKVKLLANKEVNVTDKTKNITKRAKILRVISNQVNADYDRRKIITKGTLIETSIGEATITSRPGQHGILNAVLMN